MTCARCGGLMLFHVEVKPTRWRCWRCTACGERIDPVIARNRASERAFQRQSKLSAETLFQQLIAEASVTARA